ncbi:MAG TPA: carbohydrate kinase family protein [Tepidisphaeraceae bacterium]
MDAAIFGLIVADIIAEPMDLRNPPAPGGLHFVRSIQLTTGGNVCNTGVAMAKHGMKVAATGLVGTDVLAAAVTERLKASQIDTSGMFTTEAAQTCSTVVAVEPGGERCFYYTPGATALLDAASLRQCFPIFARCRYVQIGYFGLLPKLTPQLPELLAEFKAQSPQTKIALETVTPVGPWEQLELILPHLDLFIPSRGEAMALTGLADPKEMVAQFRRHMPRGLIGVKLDVEGCYLDDGTRAVTVPAYQIKVVDTTGAGDTWFAGLLTGLIHQMPLEKAGAFANRTAADCCTALGASAGVRDFNDTLARL